MRAVVIALVVALVVAQAAPVAADATIARGAVVKIEHREIYISLGDGQGVASGAPIRLKRSIKLKHPVTRAQIEDWIPIGSATVTQAAGQLSRAVIGEMVSAVRVGDLAEVLVVRDAPVPPRPPPVTPQPEPRTTPKPDPQQRQEPAKPDPVTADVLATFTMQSGSSLDARIAGWEHFLSTHATTPYNEAIRHDLDVLRRMREELQPAGSNAASETIASVGHASPRRADASRPVDLVFVMSDPDQIASAYLHYRTREKKTFGRVLLTREHDIYLRGAIPGDAVKAPGVDYFVEVSTPRGFSGLAVGSPNAPIQVEVAAPPIADALDDRPGRTTVAFAGEYLDVAMLDSRAGDRRDVFYSGTVDVSYRLDTFVQRVGVGYGVAGGRGGFRDRTFDDAMPSPTAGFHYGHASVDLGSRTGILGGSLFAGVGKEGFGVGVEGRARLGPWDGTNISVNGRFLPELGFHTDVRFGAQPARDVLLGISIGATDQPNRGDVAAKLATELAWIGHESISLYVRASWQGRSIDHGGLGGGAGVGVTW